MGAARRRANSAEMATAYHEAGHVVAAWLRKGLAEVGEVSIQPAEDSLGHADTANLLYGADPENDMTPEIRERIEEEIIVLFAGDVAQRVFSKRSVRRYHSSSDHKAAIDFGSYIAGHGRGLEAFLHWLWVCAEGIVMSNWPIIEDLAKELLLRRKIASEDLQQWLVHWHDDAAHRSRHLEWRRKLAQDETERQRALIEAARKKRLPA